jgi:hypothetical protein
MNDQKYSETVFPETPLASKLLNDFSGLVRRQKRERQKTIATQAALSFFDKSVLTISEFFEPIGNDLRIPAPLSPPMNTVKEFFNNSFDRKRNGKIFSKEISSSFPQPKLKAEPPPPLTIKLFFDPL